MITSAALYLARHDAVAGRPKNAATASIAFFYLRYTSDHHLHQGNPPDESQVITISYPW